MRKNLLEDTVNTPGDPAYKSGTYEDHHVELTGTEIEPERVYLPISLVAEAVYCPRNFYYRVLTIFVTTHAATRCIKLCVTTPCRSSTAFLSAG